MCQWGDKNAWVGYWTPKAPSQTEQGWVGRKVPFKFQPTGWRLTKKMSIEHILGYIGWLWSDATNNRTAFAKAPKEWKQSVLIYVVVELPDHHLWWWPCWWWIAKFYSDICAGYDVTRYFRLTADWYRVLLFSQPERHEEWYLIVTLSFARLLQCGWHFKLVTCSVSATFRLALWTAFLSFLTDLSANTRKAKMMIGP